MTINIPSQAVWWYISTGRWSLAPSQSASIERLHLDHIDHFNFEITQVDLNCETRWENVWQLFSCLIMIFPCNSIPLHALILFPDKHCDLISPHTVAAANQLSVKLGDSGTSLHLSSTFTLCRIRINLIWLRQAAIKQSWRSDVSICKM